VYIEKIVFNIFDNIEDAFVAFVKGNIDIIKELTPYQKDLIKSKNKIKINHTILPRYYAIFLNQKNPLLSNTKISEALDLALNKKSIIDSVFFNEAELLNAPISKGFIGYDSKLNTDNFDLALAKTKLSEAKYEDRNKDGILEK
jgi:peptide/nickel transport system substrate-binding protein